MLKLRERPPFSKEQVEKWIADNRPTPFHVYEQEGIVKTAKEFNSAFEFNRRATPRKRRGFHNKILGICGNGGSLAQASHLAGELVPLGYPCIAFNDQAVISSISNDRNYRDIFAFQIKTFKKLLFRVILLTTSGQSDNIKRALFECLQSDVPVTLITGSVTLEEIFQTDIDMLDNEYYKDYLTQIKFRGETPEVQEQTLKFIHHIYREAKK